MEKIKSFNEFFDEKINESYDGPRVPSNILDFAERKGCLPDVKKIARWIVKASNGVKYGIQGGTAIGKYYDTLVLDIKYQGAEIYFDIGDGIITFLNEPVLDYKDFKRIWNKNIERLEK